jgi:hypothetical protein
MAVTRPTVDQFNIQSIAGAIASDSVAIGSISTQLTTDGDVTISAIAIVSDDTSMMVNMTTPAIISGMTTSPAPGSYIVTYNSKFLVVDTSTITETAKLDAIALYNDLSTRAPTGNETVRTGGVTFFNETIGPGVYTQPGAVVVNGTLTLDANGDANAEFILGTTSGAFTTGVAAEIILINGATSNNVWVISSDATSTAADAIFRGSLLTLTGAASTGANTLFEGRILIANGGAIALGAGTIATTPTGVPQATLGTLDQFSIFTGAGAVSTTGIVTTVPLSIGTNLGVITGFSGIGQVGGSIMHACETETSKICVGVYVDGDLISDSLRSYNHLFNGIDHEYPIILQTVATITTGQTVDIRTWAPMGLSDIGPRMSLVLIPMTQRPTTG